MKNIGQLTGIRRGINFESAWGLFVMLLFLNAGSVLSQRMDTTKTHDRHDRIGLRGIPNLTDDQRKKIRALETPLAKDLLPLLNQLSEKRAHLRTLQTAEKTDLNAINSTIDETTQLQAQIMKKRAAHTQAIRKVLNDDQRVAFDMRGMAGERPFPDRRNRSYHGKGG